MKLLQILLRDYKQRIIEYELDEHMLYWKKFNKFTDIY